MTTITQDMNYRQSLMKYAAAHGVSKASRKYNRARSYIYFWLNRWDGSVESLRPESRRPHHHPNQHTPAELKLIHDMKRRNPLAWSNSGANCADEATPEASNPSGGCSSVRGSW